MKKLASIIVLALILGVGLWPLAVQAAGVEQGGATVVFYGKVASRPEGKEGLWLIAGREVWAVADTRLIEGSGPASVGAGVLVVARQMDNGRLEASVICVQPRSVCELLQLRYGHAIQICTQERTRQRTQIHLQIQPQAQTQQQVQTRLQICASPQTQQQVGVEQQTQVQQQSQVQQGMQAPVAQQTQVQTQAGVPARGGR